MLYKKPLAEILKEFVRLRRPETARTVASMGTYRLAQADKKLKGKDWLGMVGHAQFWPITVIVVGPKVSPRDTRQRFDLGAILCGRLAVRQPLLNRLVASNAAKRPGRSRKPTKFLHCGA